MKIRFVIISGIIAIIFAILVILNNWEILKFSYEIVQKILLGLFIASILNFLSMLGVYCKIKYEM